MPPIFNVPELRMASGAGLARDLTQVVSEPIFDIPRLVEAARYQRFDAGIKVPKPSAGIWPAPWLSGNLVIRRAEDSIMVTPTSYFVSGITARSHNLDAGRRRPGTNS